VDADRRERIGIDGYIELFDPTTRNPLGLTLAAQSEVASALCKNSSPTFDYWCDPADLEYWLAGSMFVVARCVASQPGPQNSYALAPALRRSAQYFRIRSAAAFRAAGDMWRRRGVRTAVFLPAAPPGAETSLLARLIFAQRAF